MSTTCPECGAIQPDDMTCQSVFDEFLALEFTDMGYGAVHFLTVAAFMVQHGRYSDEGLAWMLPKIRAYLNGELSIDEIRTNAGKEAGNEQRKWKVTRAPDAPPPPKINWSMSIIDVARGQTDAPSYRNLIKQWGQSILDDLDAAKTR